MERGYLVLYAEHNVLTFKILFVTFSEWHTFIILYVSTFIYVYTLCTPTCVFVYHSFEIEINVAVFTESFRKYIAAGTHGINPFHESIRHVINLWQSGETPIHIDWFFY